MSSKSDYNGGAFSNDKRFYSPKYLFLFAVIFSSF